MTRALLEKPGTPPALPSRKDPTLTMREVEILRMIAQGHTNRQVAKLLNISIRTVEFHRSNLMEKLGLDSRVELVRYAVEQGII
jgi:DNA-binding CsgD family transcriptional regulator